MQESLKTLTIKEASERLGVTCHTLRFWEKELDGVLVPLRTRGGQRRYAPGHISILRDIKRLRGKNLSLEDIKRIFNHRKADIPNQPNSQRAEFIANQIAEIVRLAVHKIFDTENLDGETETIK